NHSKSPSHDSWSSHVIYSDDHGASWHIGGVQPNGFNNESTIAELSDGRVYHNMRNYEGKNRRAIAYSDDEGMTWTPSIHDDALIEPVCQASALSFAAPSGHVVLFSNPADTKRQNLTIRLSRDDAKTWPESRTLYEGPSAYSDLAALPNGAIACLYEKGTENP